MATKKKTPIERAVSIAGGQSELKRKLLKAGHDVSQQAIGLWLKAGQAGKGWALPISRVIDFEVTPHDLDRIAYPNPWDGLPVERARTLIQGIAA